MKELKDREYTMLMVKGYINRMTDCEGYDMPNAARNVLGIFKSEYGYEIKRRGEKGAFIEWLKGVPSALSVHFYYDEVNEILSTWRALLEDRLITVGESGELKEEDVQAEDDVKQFNHFLDLIYEGIKEMEREEAAE